MTKHHASTSLDDETLRRLQLVELDILRAVDALCRDAGLVYLLDSGTLLGAVRHKGFIPWDDDIDIAMPRPDFERFLELAGDAGALPAGYSLHMFENTAGFAGMFAKVYRDGTSFETQETRDAGCPQGIFIDVFCYDELSSDASERARQLRSSGLWQRVSYLYHSSHITVGARGWVGAVLRGACALAHGIVRALFTREGIRRRFARAGAFRAAPSGDFALLPYPEFGPFPSDVLFPPSTVLFEGCEFFAPCDPERYLELAYGPTWRELPPEEKRRTHAPLAVDFGDGPKDAPCDGARERCAFGQTRAAGSHGARSAAVRADAPQVARDGARPAQGDCSRMERHG